MSTYVIAGAIEKLVNNFRETIREKNTIEREKLAFEKEKFEFNKTLKEERLKPKSCCHNWIIEVRKSDYMDEQNNEYCIVHQHCSECGMTDVRMQQIKT